jgi:hypothetical protein
MPRKVIKEESSSLAEDSQIEKEVNEIKSFQDGGVAEVLRKDGEVMRVYTREEHGEAFKKLAQQFADKRGYSLR